MGVIIDPVDAMIRASDRAKEKGRCIPVELTLDKPAEFNRGGGRPRSW